LSYYNDALELQGVDRVYNVVLEEGGQSLVIYPPSRLAVEANSPEARLAVPVAVEAIALSHGIPASVDPVAGHAFLGTRAVADALAAADPAGWAAGRIVMGSPSHNGVQVGTNHHALKASLLSFQRDPVTQHVIGVLTSNM
jgi:hypothetical protein